MSTFITYRAACPACGADVQWTATSGTVSKEENRFAIDCPDCERKEIEWRAKERPEEARTRMVAERVRRGTRTPVNLPKVTGTVAVVEAGSPGNSS